MLNTVLRTLGRLLGFQYSVQYKVGKVPQQHNVSSSSAKSGRKTQAAQEQPQAAPQTAKPKRKRVLKTTVAPLHKSELVRVPRQTKKSTEPGKQPKTPAPRTRQHVKSKVKAKP